MFNVIQPKLIIWYILRASGTSISYISLNVLTRFGRGSQYSISGTETVQMCNVLRPPRPHDESGSSSPSVRRKHKRAKTPPIRDVSASDGPSSGMPSDCFNIFIHQVTLARKRRRDLSGLQVKLPFVYHIRWRLHFDNTGWYKGCDSFKQTKEKLYSNNAINRGPKLILFTTGPSQWSFPIHTAHTPKEMSSYQSLAKSVSALLYATDVTWWSNEHTSLLFTKLFWPGGSQETMRSSSQVENHKLLSKMFNFFNRSV